MEGAVQDDNERPWELLNQPRRDCEPHRGGVLVFLANLSLTYGALSLFTLLPSFIGLPLGIVTGVLARKDLSLMAKGLMDPAGRDQAEMARIRSAYAIVLCLISWACMPLWCGLGGLFLPRPVPWPWPGRVHWN
jgi:hypothetical protein